MSGSIYSDLGVPPLPTAGDLDHLVIVLAFRHRLKIVAAKGTLTPSTAL